MCCVYQVNIKYIDINSLLILIDKNLIPTDMMILITTVDIILQIQNLMEMIVVVFKVGREAFCYRA